ncbi:MAG: hypothetical protein K5746_06380 [Clostridiales bacterium]|nr:hypothetical protein [Clostridiales bacterium]
MKERSHGNALLLELMIAIAFFMLAASVLLRVYGAANALSLRAARVTQALDAAEDAADAVIAADAPEEALTRMGYSPAENRFTREEAGFRLSVSWEEEVRPAGILLSGIIKAETDNGEELLSLPFARYKGAGHE